MNKKSLYIILAGLTLGLSFTSCSDDPEDAVSKHVYSETESPYLRTDLTANVSLNAEFRKGHIAPKVYSLKDYAETIQTKLGMTVDDMLQAVETGQVVFYNINTTKGVWDKTAQNVTNGWGYKANGTISDTTQVATVTLDKEAKALVVNVDEQAAVGTSLTENIGFALNNGKDYDDYVRFSISIAVSDPGTIIQDITIPTGDYAAYEVKFANSENALSACLGMTATEFNKTVQDVEGDIALYMVDEQGNWNTTAEYTANGIGYWCDGTGKPMGWGEGCVYFVETHDGSVGIGRYPGVASGSQYKVHFVYASKSDPSKFVEYVINATFE